MQNTLMSEVGRRVHRERGRLEAMNPVGCVNWENQGKIHPHGMQVWAQEGAVPERDDTEDQFHLHNFNRCHPRAYEIPFFKVKMLIKSDSCLTNHLLEDNSQLWKHNYNDAEEETRCLPPLCLPLPHRRPPSLTHHQVISNEESPCNLLRGFFFN